MSACRPRFTNVLGTLVLALLAANAVWAQPVAGDQPGGGDADPPTRAARLSFVQGAVSLQPAGVDDWSAATINRPLSGGDQLWSDRASRAEIQFDTATVSIADSTSLALLNVSDDAVQLQLSVGTTNITLRELDPAGAFEIDAPNASVSLVRPGSYRIGVDGAGNTTVAIRNGQVQVVTITGQSLILRGGQGAQFSSSGDVDVATVAAADDFDRWCAQRERRWTQNQDVTQYVSSDVVGAEDLNQYGDWNQDPDYGDVWYPTAVAAGWAPYRNGRWLWVTPWGWTWVDNAPWGYAPFHYGRWAYVGERWGWVPAPAGSRAAYAPALVAWMDGPAGSDVGWLPLAPGEVYLPAYRVSARYLNNVNVSNISMVNSAYIASVYQNPALQNRYANRDAPGALTVVSQSSFTSGQPIWGRTVAPPSQWQQANATPRAPPILPERQSLLGPAGQTRVRRPPLAIAARAVVARRAPPPPPPAFERQMDAMRANGGQALPPAQLQRLSGAPHPRPNIVLAPHVVPVIPEAPAAPTTPAAATLRASPARPAVPAALPAHPLPNDRRAIPERSPQFQAPTQVQRQPLPQPELPAAALRDIAPPPPPRQQQQQPAPRPAPPARAPERIIKGEPP